MPTSKDLKRLTRFRMQKTGESYTTARARLLEKKKPAAAAPEPKADFAALAGVADEAVRAKTGRSWKEWVRLLDAEGAAGMSHGDIAKHLRSRFEVSSWWAQSVTVGYERIRGLRDVGQKRGGTYESNKSKTLPSRRPSAGKDGPADAIEAAVGATVAQKRDGTSDAPILAAKSPRRRESKAKSSGSPASIRLNSARDSTTH